MLEYDPNISTNARSHTWVFRWRFSARGEWKHASIIRITTQLKSPRELSAQVEFLIRGVEEAFHSGVTAAKGDVVEARAWKGGCELAD